MKKLLNGILVAVLLLCMTVGMAGCRYENYLPEYETEYFRYAVRTNKDGTQRGYLIGMTELGMEQTHLILPDEIDGVPIVAFGYQIMVGFWETEDVGNFSSENLSKLYVPFSVNDNSWKVPICFVSMKNCYSIQWKKYYYMHHSLKGRVVAYKAAEEYFNSDRNNSGYYSENDKFANLIYKLNYRGAPDSGYYWVDSYDNETIEFIPPEPIREGYRFEGWYKEPSCENKWNFETDKVGKEIVIRRYSILEDYDGCEVTRLYAKWIKN